MSKKKDWKDPKDYLIEAYTNKLINDYKQDDEKEQERQRQRALSSPSTSNTTNSPVSSQKSSQTANTVSKEASAVRDIAKLSGRRHTTADRNNVEDRRSGRYRTSRNERSTFSNTGRTPIDRERGRVGNAVVGAGKQWLGGQISSVGTTAQELETTANSYNRAKAEDDNPYYSLRSREEAEKRQELYQKRLGVKEGVDIKNAERVYEYSPNSVSQKIIKKGDKLIESGIEDTEKAKEGAGTLGRLAIDLGTNALQMAGDYSLAFVPVVGQALSFGSLMNRAGGTASYEARQMGLNPDQQFTYQQGTALVEGLSERIFNSVTAFRTAYGKGAFDLADRVGTRVASSEIVKDFLKSENGRIVAYNLAKLGTSMAEEGTEELIADIAEPALKYCLTHDPEQEGTGNFVKGMASSPFHTEDTVQGSIKNMAYDFMVGALMAGMPGGVDFARNVKAEVTSRAFSDGQAYAEAKMQQAQVQGREGQAPTDAEILGQQLQEQKDKGLSILPGQVKQLERAISQSSEQNAVAFEQKSRAREEQAIADKTLAPSSNTQVEETETGRRETKVEQEKYQQAKEAMGEGASELSVGAVGRVLSGTATVDDHDVILADPKAKDALQKITGIQLSANNGVARTALENITSSREIMNKSSIRQEVQTQYAEQIANEIGLRGKRGNELFTENYNDAVSKIGSGEVYESVFMRLYSDGLVESADFKDSYDRIVAPLGQQVTSYFTEDFAKRIFNEGRASALAETAKSVARKRADSEIKLRYEDNTEGKLNPKQAKALEAFAKRTKVPVVIYEDKADNNGYYDPKTDTIYISINATNKLITVAKHELTHHIKATAPARYKELEDFVFERWYHSDKNAMEEAIRKKQRDYGDITPEIAREEIIADASEAFFTDSSAIHDAINFSKKLGKAIHDGIKTILDTFLSIQEGDDLPYRGYGEFLKELNILKDAERMWLEALDESVNSNSTGSEELDEYLEKHDLKVLNSKKDWNLDWKVDSADRPLGGNRFNFFRKSQAVDREGKLARLYHTTNRGGFSVFDPKQSVSSEGIFFSSSFAVSQTYGWNADKPVVPGRDALASEAMDIFVDENWGADDLNKRLKVTRSVFVEGDEAGDDEFSVGFGGRFETSEPTDLGKTPAEQLRNLAEGIDNGTLDPEDYIVSFDDRLHTLTDQNSLKDGVTADWFFKRVADAYGGAQHGYYEVYLNLVNPLIVEGHGSDWNSIPVELDFDDSQIKDQAMMSVSKFVTEWEKDRDGNITGVKVRIEGEYKDYFSSDWKKLDETKTFKGKNKDALMERVADFWEAEQGLSMADFVELEDYFQYADGEIYADFTDTSPMYFDNDGESLDPDDYKTAIYSTNSLARLAKKHGYDGVIIRNIADIGGDSELGGADPYSDIYIAFNSNQIKLTSNENPTKDKDIRRSVKVSDEEYMKAVQAGDMTKAQELVDEMAKRKGWRPRHLYHGTLAYGFTVFDKAKAHVGGNSGAGFYFSTEEDDSINHYADEEGADNFFKRQALAERIWDAGEWDGEAVESYEEAEEIARKELNKNPGTYDVYLKYDNPYIRNFRKSTNIYEAIMWDFNPDDYVSREDYDDEYEYDDAVNEEMTNYLYDEIYTAVYNAWSDLTDTYDSVDMQATIEDVARQITENAFDYERINWDDILNAVEAVNNIYGIEIMNDEWGDTGDGSAELTRAIIENLGYDAIEDKEVSSKFGQLSREMMNDTEHIIVFSPNQIKSSEPVTRDDNGEVIPLSERFNEHSNDLRRSKKSASNAELANRNDTAVFIRNTKNANYIDMIFSGKKTEETRARRTLDKFIGKNVMITDGNKVYGTVVFGEPHRYTASEFHSREAQRRHRVPAGDTYDIQQGKTKWAYPIESYEKFDKPRALSNTEDYLGSRQARQVRFSKKEDRDYLNAVNRGDMETAQRMVDEQAKRNGYDIEYAVWRGDSRPYNVLEAGVSGGNLGTGLYFTPQRSYAERFGRGGAVRKFYLKKGKMFDYTKFAEEFNSYANEVAEEYGERLDSMDEMLWSMAWDEFIADNEYDSVKAIGVGGFSYGAEEIAVQESWQAKSADPVTYDDNGEIIPLSQRFNDKTNDIRFSKKTENEPLPKGRPIPDSLKQWMKEMGVDELSKDDAKAPVNVSVRDLRSYWYEFNGRQKEGQLMNQVLKNIGDRLTELAGDYNYIGLGDALNATVHYRTDENGNPTSVILSCQVKNAEYEVNYDFTTICKKRAPLQRVLERFIKTEGEHMDTLYDELRLDEEGLYKLRLIMEQAGFEVSCIACFVEQNRYSQQHQSKVIADDWNKALDEWAKDNNTTVTENFDLKNLDLNTIPYEQIRRDWEKYSQALRDWKEAHKGTDDKANVAVVNRLMIESVPYFRKRLNPSDNASIEGQRAMMAMGNGSTNLYNFLKRGQGDSKQSVPFVAYNGEVALLPDKMKSKSLYDYLISVGGARAQSASDFQIEYVYDYMQMIADLSARGLPMHMYTKVIELAELFGMTGVKINLSAMCDVDDSVDGEHAGLKYVNGKWEYNISEQSVDFDRAVEIQKRKGYTKNVGIIMVTLSQEHMLKALGDRDIRYIIGYHSSAMPTVIANASNMSRATDYTKINKTNRLNEKGRALFNEAMKQAKGKTDLEKYKNALRIFDRLIQRETAKKKKPPRRGNEYGSYMSGYGANTADFDVYEDIKTTNDARKTADNYLRYCMENDLIPIYFPFAFHPNYYKCEVYDFNMYDNISGKYAPMQPVQNIYPGLDITKGQTDTTEFMKLVSGMMDEQNKENKKLEPMYDYVDRRARAELGINVTGNEYIDIDGTGIKHSELEHRSDMEEKRQSLKEKNDPNAKTIEYKRTIDRLEEKVANLKREMKRTKLNNIEPNTKQTRSEAGKLVKRHGTNARVQNDVVNALTEIFRMYQQPEIWNNNKLKANAFSEIYKVAEQTAVEIVNNIKVVHDSGAEDYKAIKDFLKSNPITVPDSMRESVSGSKLRLKKSDSSNIAQIYNELSDMFPDQFTEDYTTPIDQLNHISDVMEDFAPYYENLSGSSEEMQDYVALVASDIMETAYDLRTKRTFADRKYEEKTRAIEREREKALVSREKALEKQRAKYEKRVEELQEALWRANENTEVAKMRGEMAVQEQKQKFKEYKEEKRERAEKKRRLRQIANIYKRLSDKLVESSDTKHLPDDYYHAVSKVLELFDFTTVGMYKWAGKHGRPSDRLEKILDLQDVIERIANSEAPEVELDPDFVDMTKELTKAFRGANGKRALEDFNATELENIAKIFSGIEHQVNTFNKRLVEGQKQTTSETAKAVVWEAGEVKRGKWRAGIMGRWFTSNLNPSDFFTLIGGTVEELYNETRKGFDRYVENLDKAQTFIQGQIKPKTADEWVNHKATFTTSDGKNVELTDTQLMSLYCLVKREQAVGHIFGQGIVSAPVKIKKGLTAKQLDETRVYPTVDDVTEWLKSLSPEQIKVAEAIQEFFVDETSAWGNETSMKLYGYKKFTEKHYFPIQSSKDYLETNFDAKGTDPTLKNISPTRALTRGANSPIVIDDIFSVFAKHTSQMASYNAYVPAITDFTRVWNYKVENENGKLETVKEIFRDTYKDGIYNYVDQFFKDLNGVYKSNLDITMPDKLFSAFKKSAVGGNIRVLLQQPMAIARAGLIINPAYLTASVPKTTAQAKKVYKEMLEHCPIAKWKTWGFYSMDITGGARDLKNVMLGKESAIDKIFMDSYGVADNITWTVIFNACKMQVEAQNKGIEKGSDEYWEKVSALATKVFDRTQVVDSPFHRSEIMKSKDMGHKMMTMFMAEPTKTLNMINTEVALAMRALGEKKVGKATGILTRVTAVTLANAMLLAVGQSLVDAMRSAGGGDDDEDKGTFEERFRKNWMKNTKDNLNIANMLPLVKDVLSIAQGYSVTRPDLSGIEKLVKAVNRAKKYYEDPENSKYTEVDIWTNLALQIAYARGIPLPNAKRDLEAVILTGMEATGNYEGFFTKAKLTYSLSEKSYNRYIFADMYYDALERGDKELANKIYKYMISKGVTKKYIDGRKKTWKEHKEEEAGK